VGIVSKWEKRGGADVDDLVEENRSHWPVFLIGCHRSGTTLLRYLLDAHDNLACPPESKFIAGVQALFEYPQALPALLSLGFTVDDVYLELRKLIEAFLGGYARNERKSRWVDKTPNYYRNLDFIDDVFEGRVLYLFIVRHPLDCVESLTEFFYYASSRNDPEARRAAERYGAGRYGWAKYWAEVNERLYVFAASNPDRCHLFHYESVIEDTRASMSAVLAFLGETLPEDLIEKAFRKRHTEGFQDHKIGDTQSILNDRVGKWKDWSSSEIAALWRVVCDTATNVGYRSPVP
jgi:hypothetical protein